MYPQPSGQTLRRGTAAARQSASDSPAGERVKKKRKKLGCKIQIVSIDLEIIDAAAEITELALGVLEDDSERNKGARGSIRISHTGGRKDEEKDATRKKEFQARWKKKKKPI